MNAVSKEWMKASFPEKYSYNFSWLGRKIIQYPQDIVAMQEIIWTVKPDLIIETGVAHGGSAILYASMLELNAICGGPQGKVLSIDVDIRMHNLRAIYEHPLAKRIGLIQGSSVDPSVIRQVKQEAQRRGTVLVCLDSNHTHEHVLAELEAYAPFTTPQSYCVVFDTIVEDLPQEFFPDRPWGPGNNPRTAMWEYLKTHPEFEADPQMEKLQLSTAQYLKRLR